MVLLETQLRNMEFDRTHESFHGRCCIPVDSGARSLRFKKPSTQLQEKNLVATLVFFLGALVLIEI